MTFSSEDSVPQTTFGCVITNSVYEIGETDRTDFLDFLAKVTWNLGGLIEAQTEPCSLQLVPMIKLAGKGDVISGPIAYNC